MFIGTRAPPGGSQLAFPLRNVTELYNNSTTPAMMVTQSSFDNNTAQGNGGEVQLSVSTGQHNACALHMLSSLTMLQFLTGIFELCCLALLACVFDTETASLLWGRARLHYHILCGLIAAPTVPACCTMVPCVLLLHALCLWSTTLCLQGPLCYSQAHTPTFSLRSSPTTQPYWVVDCAQTWLPMQTQRGGPENMTYAQA